MFEEKIIPLPDDTFRLLRDLIHGYCGIYFDDGSKFLLERRLSRRLEQRQLKTFEEYHHFLRYDRKREEELAVLVDNLTTNETYFFRETPQLDAFSREILPELRQTLAARRTLRIWSAGCSTGEEPYTIAILLLESGDWWRDWQVEIVGSDINQRVLHTARKGVYKKGAHRATSPEMLRKYFVEEDKGNYRIIDRVRELVSFSYVNLLDPYKTSLISNMDIIFCRNVIIYFDREAKKKVIGSFYDKLRQGGYLLLGHSESLINISNAFVLRTLKNDMVYQKPVRESREVPLFR
ncbi:MAG: chemotaxis protein CheR [Nitrospirae bacterium GWD2_57_9]|nr:MAG: chemotaxis protein CheR [Nitrospirae bacterium GWD2_57_9]